VGGVHKGIVAFLEALSTVGSGSCCRRAGALGISDLGTCQQGFIAQIQRGWNAPASGYHRASSDRAAHPSHLRSRLLRRAADRPVDDHGGMFKEWPACHHLDALPAAHRLITVT